LVAALWVNAALLAVIVLTMLNRGSVPSVLPGAYAQNQQPIAGGAGVFIMPAQMATNVWGTYLLDVDSKTICAYQFFPGEKNLRLSAVRSYKYDTRLERFNTENPSPREVKAMVEKAQAADRAAEAPPAGEGKDK
jgi:hypothetical protein